ncbi:MAG: ABC transporter permease subunit [Acidobacteriota bacterium]
MPVGSGGSRLARAAGAAMRMAGAVGLTATALGLLLYYSPGREYASETMTGFGLAQEGPAGRQGLEPGPGEFVGQYLRNLLRGDFGYSSTFQTPVGRLVAERAARTAGQLLSATGLLSVTVCVFLLGGLWRDSLRGWIGLAAMVLQSIPPALFAIPIVLASGPPFVAIALAALPRTLRVLDAVVVRQQGSAHVAWMRAMGCGWWAMTWHGQIRAAGRELGESAASMVPLLLGSLLAVEIVVGYPGLGTLAWRGVYGRDLPLLGAVTLLFSGATSLSAAVAQREER